jgi:hypothetical protein
VKAGKAYISSLGTTGLLIASSLLLLLLVGTILAFDRWPTDSPAGSETVAIGSVAPVRPDRGPAAERRRQARAERRRAAARRREARARARVARASRPAADAHPAPEGRVVSSLPAPDSDPLGGGPMGGTGGGGVGTRSNGAVGGGAPDGDPAGHVGDAVSQVSPDAGSTVGQVGQAVDQALNQSAPSLAP